MNNLYKNELLNYVLITKDNILNVPLGSHIKTVDSYNNLRSAGFLVKKDVMNKEIFKNHLVVKSNIYYKLYIKKFVIYYKVIDKMTKRKIFVQFLKNLEDEKQI